MKERPILFSGPMVRAILEGRKTQTRRVIKPQPTIDWHYRTWWDRQTYAWTTCHPLNIEYQNQIQKIKCPYGQPGDRLWVKETWCDVYDIKNMNFPPRKTKDCTNFYYCADYTNGDMVIKWRPSIHMPRRASRIILEIDEIRVERVQDISNDDAFAEGVLPNWTKSRSGYTTENPAPSGAAFANLWESINAKRGYGWETNPWVWVIKFHVVEVKR